MDIKSLENKAREVRLSVVRLFSKVGGGHFGGSLSAVEIIVSLYYKILKLHPDNPKWEDRDRFILSKGHACPTLYAVLWDKGYISDEIMEHFEELDNPLTMHPDMTKVPVDMSTGSLGHGLSVGVGMALAGKMDRRDYRVFVLLGDGECQEGSVWEAIMAGAHFKLDNLVAIVDRNRLSNDGFVEEIMSLEPLVERWRSFGWEVKEIDGHKINEITNVLEKIPFKPEKPSVVICHTIKGKGISFIENKRECHRMDITKEQIEQALKEIEANYGYRKEKPEGNVF